LEQALTAFDEGKNTLNRKTLKQESKWTISIGVASSLS
jgi:hypothetical protein